MVTLCSPLEGVCSFFLIFPLLPSFCPRAFKALVQTPPVETFRRLSSCRTCHHASLLWPPCFYIKHLASLLCLFHYLTPFSFVLRLLRYVFLLFKSCNPQPNHLSHFHARSTFLPDFHAPLSSTKQLTLFYSTDFSLIRLCFFISCSFLLLKRMNLREMETYSHVNASQHEINALLSQARHKTVQQTQVENVKELKLVIVK